MASRLVTLVVLCHRSHEPRSKVLRQPVKRGILLLKKALYVGRNLVLVAKQKVVRVIEYFARLALFEGDFTLHTHQHGRGSSRRGVNQRRTRFTLSTFPRNTASPLAGSEITRYCVLARNSCT